MRTKIFQDVYSQYNNQGREWLREKVRLLQTRGRIIIRENRDLLHRWPRKGKMYMFAYFPKDKNRDKLEYFDALPLVIPTDRYGNRQYFNAMNLHYLFPQMRNSFIESILQNGTSQRNINRNLNRFLTSSGDSNTIMKRYSYGSCRSRFLEIPPEEWDLAMALPIEEFRKKHKTIAWRDTREKLL